MRVIIDAGHGGTSRAGSSSAFGSRGPAGTVEKEVTLDIARHVSPCCYVATMENFVPNFYGAIVAEMPTT